MTMGISKYPKGRCEYDGRCYRVNKFHWEDYSHELQDGPVAHKVDVDDWLTKSSANGASSSAADDSSRASTQGDGGKDGGGEKTSADGGQSRKEPRQVLVPETPDPSPAKTDVTLPFPSSIPSKRPADTAPQAADSDNDELVVAAKRSTKRSRVIADSDDEDEILAKPSPKMKNSVRVLDSSDDEEAKTSNESPDGWQTVGRAGKSGGDGGSKPKLVDLTDDVSDMRAYKPRKRRIKEDDSDASDSEDGEDEEESDDDADLTAEQVLGQCELISQSLSHSLGSMVGNESQAAGGGDNVGQPKCLGEETGFKLKHYQLVGMNWLRVLHTSDVNGILADEMGLGKTVQSIAFLAHLFEREDQRGPHLIVCPASVVSNWQREFSSWLPALRVVVYHGSQQERTTLRGELGYGKRWDVMLTTYTYFEREGCKPDRNFLKKIDFTCVILDEAHSIKNASSSRYKRLLNITCQRRFLLTGTPINNSLPELLVLLAFLMPDLFDLEDDALQEYFSEKKSDSGAEASRVERVRQLMAPFVLRRRKRDVLTELVPKVEKLERLELDTQQRQVYSGIIAQWKSESRARKSEEESKAEPEHKGKRRRELGTPPDSKKAINNVFCELRKAANHPLLVRSVFNERTVDTIATHLHNTGYFGMDCSKEQVLVEVSGYSDFQLHGVCKEERRLSRYALTQEQIGSSAKLQHLAQLLPKLKEDGHRVLLFSQWTTMLDIIEEYIIGLGVNYLRLDGSTAVQQRQDLMDKYNRDKDILCFLLSTRAGGVGINLTAADTVVLHDVDFNPQIDKQAEDRCHRIGQTRPVTIYRLVAAGTVDEEINKLAEQKGKLASEMLDQESEDAEDVMVLDEDEGGKAKKSKGGAATAGGKGQSMQEIIEQMLAKVLAEEETVDAGKGD